uniref:Putative trypsin-like serine protease n=1 Tax=Lutzomyia longipalpis TaxID=7200 RepID=A0A7G3B183_LUTLO
MFRQICLIGLFCVVGVISRSLEVEVDVQKNVPSWVEDSQNFMIGGQAAFAGQFPHVASVRNTANVHVCGGFIINNRWVVSSALCTVNRTPDDTWIIVGALQLSNGGTNVFTSNIINHPDYINIGMMNDISLLQTRDSITFSNLVQPLELGSTFIGSGSQATFAAWGATASTGPLISILQWQPMMTIGNQECEWQMPSMPIFNNNICAITHVGRGMCRGNLGSAVFIGNNAIGTHSWSPGGCASGFPEVFSRISSHREWILSHAG